LIATGTVQSLVLVGEPGDLLATAFGRAVAIKAALVLVLLACGALNRFRSIPSLERGRDAVVVRRVLAVELAIGVGALVVAGALSGYAPTG